MKLNALKTLAIISLLFVSVGQVLATNPAPTNLGATFDGQNIKLTWNRGGDVYSGHAIYKDAASCSQSQQSTDINADNHIATTGYDILTYTDPNIAPGSSYIYCVRAFTGTTTGPPSNSVSGTATVSSPNNNSSTPGPVNPNTITQDIINGLMGCSSNCNPSSLFVWAIGIGAILAFGVIVYGGVLWSVSLGGEQKNNAKEWIKGAVYGLLLLIAAYVVLYTINPNLVKL